MSWERLPIGDLLQRQSNKRIIQQGWSPKCHAHPAAPEEWGVLKTTAIQPGKFEPEHNKALPDTLDPRSNIEVKVGDLLITCAGPRARCGIPALVQHTPARLMLSGKMYRLRPGERIDARFLEMYLMSPDAQKRIDEMKTGISDSGLNLTHDRFVQLPVPVPPLEEQHRIVAILEEHLSHLAVADSQLSAALRRVDSLWKKTLARVTIGALAPLNDLSVVAGYGTSEKCVVDGPGPAVVRIPNLVDGRIDLTDEKRVADRAADVTRSKLSPGDLLIVRSNGSVDLIGRSAVVQEGIDAAFASYLIRYRLRGDVVRPRWVQAMLSTPQLRRRIESLAASSAGQHNLSLGKLGPLPIPVPAIEEQDAALTQLDAFDADRRRILVAITNSRARSGSLRRALLATAFSGQLTGTGSDA